MTPAAARQLCRVALVVFGGEEDDQGLRGARLDAQTADELVAVHRGHHEIGDDELGILGTGQLQGLLAIAGFDDGVATRTQARRTATAVRRRRHPQSAPWP